MISSMTKANGHIDTFVPDELTLAVHAAKSRIGEVYANGCKTLIDLFAQEDWENRDGASERCLVEDSSSMEPELSQAA